MATAEELLAGEVAPNEVSDRPNLLVIDNDLRTISIQPESRVIGVESDEDVNRLYFSMPRMYDDTDLSLFSAYINYMNANGDGDVYIVTDLQPTEDEITFSWLVGRHATECKGEVKFVVCLKRSENGEIVQEFNTTVHKLTVLEGLEIELTEEEEGKVRDVLAQLLSLIEAQKDEAIEAVKTEGTSQVTEVSTSGAAQVQAVNNAGNEQKAAVEAAGQKELAAIKEVGADQLIADLNAAGAAQQSAIENKAANALASIPEDYTKLDKTVKSLADLKADAIIDTSARAASHELHAQSGPMSVTLFGKTTETGSGDKSPENPYVISGVSEAQIAAASENLMDSSISPTNQYIETGVAVGDVVTPKYSTGSKLYKKVTQVTAGKTYYLICQNPVQGRGNIGTKQSVIADENDVVLVAGTDMRLWNSNKPLLTVRFTPSASGYLWLTVDKYAENVAIVEAANTVTPPLLPLNADGTGEPLMGDGTVDDVIENDVLSGCDKKITFAEGDDLTLANFDAAANVVYSDTTAGIVVTDGAITSTLTYPLTVFYRSTEYTPGKDIRVTKVTRKCKTLRLDGSDDETYKGSAISGGSLSRWNIAKDASKTAISVVGDVKANWLPSVTANNTWFGTQGISINQNGHIQAFISDAQTGEELRAMLVDNPLTVVYALATPEVYMTDCYELRKPCGLIPVTVTGSGETEVEYPHDTKHYIDSQIAAAVALALNG